MATINQFGNKQQPVLADLLHLWSTGSATDMNINLEQLRDLMIGTLANLDTTDKASIVAAINELNGPVKYMAGKPRNSIGTNSERFFRGKNDNSKKFLIPRYEEFIFRLHRVWFYFHAILYLPNVSTQDSVTAKISDRIMLP